MKLLAASGWGIQKIIIKDNAKPTVGRMGLMQTVLNQKPSCLVKGDLAFLIMWRFMKASVGVPY
jgi:hypothetical protein